MSEGDFKKYETSYRQYYGKDYDEALNNLRTTKKNRLKDEFIKKYPNAHLDRISFNVVLSKTGDVTETNVSFKVRDDQFLDITTKILKNSIRANYTGCREYGVRAARSNPLSYLQHIRYRIIIGNLLFTPSLDSQVILER